MNFVISIVDLEISELSPSKLNCNKICQSYEGFLSTELSPPRLQNNKSRKQHFVIYGAEEKDSKGKREGEKKKK